MRYWPLEGLALSQDSVGFGIDSTRVAECYDFVLNNITEQVEELSLKMRNGLGEDRMRLTIGCERRT